MSISDKERQAFKEFEKAGWNQQGEHYDSLVGQTTLQAVDPLLGAVRMRSGTTLLDVASGPGYVAAAATRRGADATGIDLSETMVDQARLRFPGVKYELGDAEHLDHPNASFDSVVCAFGMLHFPRPGRAVAEAYRVLRPGGRYAFTVWCGPPKAKLLTLIADVIQKHAGSSVAVPPGPGLFMLSDPWICVALMESATFSDVAVDELPCVFEAASPNGVFDMMRKSTVRANYVYDRQLPDVQLRIEEALKDEAAKALAAGEGKIPCPALLVSGTKGR